MKHMLFFLVLSGALGFAADAVANDEPLPLPGGQPVVGALYYREDCVAGSFAHPVLPGEQNLQVFLTDADNNVLTDGILVRPDGTFAIPDVAPGSYYLRIQAQNLNSFWDGAAFKMLPLTVSEASASADVGNLCIDNDRPAIGGIHAYSHRKASFDARDILSLTARVVDADRHSVRVSWSVSTGELVPTGTDAVEWVNTDGASQVLVELTVTDDHGGEQRVSQIVDTVAPASALVAKR